MLLTSVILVLQETLEAALLFSILAVITLQIGARPRAWLASGIVLGAVLALVYALNLRRISGWFDYVGQELTNAVLQLGMTVTIVALVAWLGRTGLRSPAAADGKPTAFNLLCVLVIALAITREGSEVLVFLGGFLAGGEALRAVLLGSGIGFGIGVSVGFLLFYGLLALTPNSRWRGLPLALLALFSGNKLAQAVLQLTQADWLQAGPALWDTSSWLPEQSIVGRLLYALVGYESSPSAAQVIAYLAGAAAVPLAYATGRRRRR